MEIIKRFVMNRGDIGFFKAIVESYEEVAIFSVLDGEKGIIEVIYPFNYEDTVKSIMSDMAQYGIFFQEVRDV